MTYLLATFGPICQLGQVFWLISGFLYVLLAVVAGAMGFLFDVVTWFSLGLYQFYLPFIAQAWHFFEAGLNMQCP